MRDINKRVKYGKATKRELPKWMKKWQKQMKEFHKKNEK